MDLLMEIAGWTGTILIVSAYFLVSREYVTGKSRIYQTMNLLGAIGVGINVFHYEAWPTLALQVAWGIIAIVSLIRPTTP